MSAPPDLWRLGSFLREAGLFVTPQDVADGLLALAAWPGAGDLEEAVARLQPVLAHDAHAYRELPRLVRAFLRGERPLPSTALPSPSSAPRGEGALPARAKAPEGEGAMPGETGARSRQGEGEAADGQAQGPSREGEHLAASAAPGPRRQGEGAQVVPHLGALMRRYARLTQPPPSRRLGPAPRGEVVDLPRTWERSLATAGEPLAWAWRARRAARPHRVVLVDTSASMDAQEGFLRAFARQAARPPVAAEVYAFSTRLWGRWREEGHTGKGDAAGFGGGTRIGESLWQYLSGPGRRLRRHSHVMIISDGWETGRIEILDRALGVLTRRAGRVDWLSPLAGTEGFEPTCRGLATSLRHGIPVFDLHDGPSFARYLDRLEAEGGVRRRRPRGRR